MAVLSFNDNYFRFPVQHTALNAPPLGSLPMFVPVDLREDVPPLFMDGCFVFMVFGLVTGFA